MDKNSSRNLAQMKEGIETIYLFKITTKNKKNKKKTTVKIHNKTTLKTALKNLFSISPGMMCFVHMLFFGLACILGLGYASTQKRLAEKHSGPKTPLFPVLTQNICFRSATGAQNANQNFHQFLLFLKLFITKLSTAACTYKIGDTVLNMVLPFVYIYCFCVQICCVFCFFFVFFFGCEFNAIFIFYYYFHFSRRCQLTAALVFFFFFLFVLVVILWLVCILLYYYFIIIIWWIY